MIKFKQYLNESVKSSIITNIVDTYDSDKLKKNISKIKEHEKSWLLRAIITKYLNNIQFQNRELPGNIIECINILILDTKSSLIQTLKNMSRGNNYNFDKELKILLSEPKLKFNQEEIFATYPEYIQYIKNPDPGLMSKYSNKAFASKFGMFKEVVVAKIEQAFDLADSNDLNKLKSEIDSISDNDKEWLLKRFIANYYDELTISSSFQLGNVISCIDFMLKHLNKSLIETILQMSKEAWGFRKKEIPALLKHLFDEDIMEPYQIEIFGKYPKYIQYISKPNKELLRANSHKVLASKYNLLGEE